MSDGRPEWIEHLEADIGPEVVRRVLARASGMRLYVPRPGNTRATVLCAVAGQAVADWAAERYAGEYLEVPSARAQARDSLRRAVTERPDAAVNELAHRYGVTARRVLQVRAEIARGCSETEPPLLRLARRASSDT